MPTNIGVMRYWLVKTEPYKYSWDDFLRDGWTVWDGVRNYQARNNLKSMKIGDRVLFYHSNKERSVVGIAEVVKEAYQDPTTSDERWVVVDIKPVQTLRKPVTLERIRENPLLRGIALLRQARLSVMPLTREEFEAIVAAGMGEG